jgi:hypothetical protein
MKNKIKIEVGKGYITRDRKHIVFIKEKHNTKDYPFIADSFDKDGMDESFSENGLYIINSGSDKDLVEEINPFDKSFVCPDEKTKTEKVEPKERKTPVKKITDGLTEVDKAINDIDASIKRINSEYKIAKLKTSVLEEDIVNKDKVINNLKKVIESEKLINLELLKENSTLRESSITDTTEKKEVIVKNVISDRKIRFKTNEFKTIEAVAKQNDKFKRSKIQYEKEQWVNQRELVMVLRDSFGIICNHDQISSIKRGKYSINQCIDYK